jgi:arginine N-succinyltransferase
MEVVRAVQAADLEQLWELIRQSTAGLTTLQITRAQLLDRVERSVFAFHRQTEKPSGEPYLFVMEDMSRGKLVGMSCIFSKVGGFEPLYHYRLVNSKQHCDLLQVTHDITALHLEKIHDGPTEIGSLFLLEKYRGQGRGRLLSLSRFQFMAQHPQRFHKDIIAEMRGVLDKEGHSPFWESVGKQFFHIDFPQADSLSTFDKQFIEDLMPKYPIYTCLLPEAVRNVIGKVHEQTKPALKMLQDEGFLITDMIDIFDGGPVVHCRRDEIDAIKRSKQRVLVDVDDAVTSDSFLVGSSKKDFRCCLSPVRLVENGIVVPSIVLAKLQVHVGDPLVVTAQHPQASE